MPRADTIRRVLITGCQGFTGRHLAARLDTEGYEVLGSCSRPEHCSQHPVIPARRLFPLDLAASPDQIRGALERIRPDAVIHLAALAFVAHGSPDDFYRVNLLGTRHLLAALADLPAPPRKVILASSANIYGNSRSGQLDEDTPPAPANDYAVSKLAMEQMARLWQDRLPILITRPFNYTGPGQAEHFLVPKIVRHFVQRAPVLELGNLDVSRDFSDIRAIVAAYAGLLASPVETGTYNICSGQSLSLQDILEICARVTGHQPEIRVNPAFVRAGEVRELCGDPARLRSILPHWRPVPLRETLPDWLNAL